MDEVENWVPIRGFENRYLISDLGRIRSLPKKFCPRDRFLKLSLNMRGYYVLGLWNGYYLSTCLVSRLVAIHFIPNPLNLPEVNHKDGIKTNNKKSNLEWMTRRENLEHAVKTGLYKTKVPISEIPILLEKFNSGSSTRGELAKEYGLSIGHVCRIIKRRVRKTLL